MRVSGKVANCYLKILLSRKMKLLLVDLYSKMINSSAYRAVLVLIQLCGEDFRIYRMILTLVVMQLIQMHSVSKHAVTSKFADLCGHVTTTTKTLHLKFHGELARVSKVNGTISVLHQIQYKQNLNFIFSISKI